jgi:hypothetical protein
VDKVNQDQVPQYYWSFGVNWIPYATDHPFNEASCPTKIMDGLASGRPILSTAIPECLLYPDWITIARSASEAAHEIKTLIDCQFQEEPRQHARQQVEFAGTQTWSTRGGQLVDLLV